MTFEARFKVGDMVWHATFDAREKWVTCPHCLSHKFAKVTFGDGEEVNVDCAECAPGFDPPHGVVRIYEHEPRACLVEVMGIDINRNNSEGRYEVRYSLSDYRSGNENNVFDNESQAMEMALKLSAQWDESECQRVARKDKPSQTWSRNASYHRQALKRAQRDVEYHTRKLDAAKQHVKDEKVLT